MFSWEMLYNFFGAIQYIGVCVHMCIHAYDDAFVHVMCIACIRMHVIIKWFLL